MGVILFGLVVAGIILVPAILIGLVARSIGQTVSLEKHPEEMGMWGRSYFDV